MFCRKCGAKLEPTWKFCRQCGGALARLVPPAETTGTTPPRERTESSDAEEKAASLANPSLQEPPVVEFAGSVDVRMFCRKCGTNLDPSWKFCRKCGSPVVRTERPAQPTSLPKLPYQRESPLIAESAAPSSNREVPQPVAAEPAASGTDVFTSCPNCGTKLDPYWKFCRTCGDTVSVTEPSSQASNFAAPPNHAEPVLAAESFVPPGKRRLPKAVVIGGIVVAAVVTIAFGGYWVWKTRQVASPGPESTGPAIDSQGSQPGAPAAPTAGGPPVSEATSDNPMPIPLPAIPPTKRASVETGNANLRTANVAVCNPGSSNDDRSLIVSPIVFIPVRSDCWSGWVMVSRSQALVVDAPGEVVLLKAGGEQVILSGSGKRDVGSNLVNFRVRGSAGQAVFTVQAVAPAEPTRPVSKPKDQLQLGMVAYRSGRFSESTVALIKALDLGQTVTLPVQHHHGNFLEQSVNSGTLTISADRVTFRESSDPSHNFDVTGERIYTLKSEPQKASRVHVNVGIVDGGKEHRKDYNFQNVNTREMKCVPCDDSMLVLYALLDHVRKAVR